MTLSSRETVLAFSTLAVLLVGATYLIGRAKFAQWEELKEERSGLEEQIVLSERLISQKDVWDDKLASNMGSLKVYPRGVNVTPKLLEIVGQTAQQCNLTLGTVSPGSESNLGEVSEFAIKYSWEGNLEAMVRFLYALENADGMFKVRILTASPTGKDGTLKGLITVDCAYTRETAAADGAGRAAAAGGAP